MKYKFIWIALFFVLVFLIWLIFSNQNQTSLSKNNIQFEKNIENIQKLISKEPQKALKSIDSLLATIQLKTSNYNDSLLGKLFLLKGNAHSNLQESAKALSNYHKSLYYFEKSGNLKLKSRTLTNLGLFYTEKLQFDSASYYYNQSCNIKESIKDSIGLTTLLNNIAIMHIWQGKYTDAINEFYESLELVKTGDDLELMSNIYNNIANVYSMLDRYDESIDNYKKSIKLDSTLKNFNSIAITYSNIGILYDKSRKFDEAIKYFTLSSELSKKYNFKNHLVKNTLNLANTYIHMKDYNYAKKILDELNTPIEDLKHLFNYNQLYSSIYFHFKQYDKSIEYLENLLSLNIQDYSIHQSIDLYKQLSMNYQQRQNYKQALDYFMKAAELQDSLNISDATSRIQELEVKYKTKEKEQENQILRVEQERKKQILNFLYILIGVIIIAASIFFYLYRKNKHLSQLVSEKNQLLENVNNELFNTLELRTKFISIISHDLKNSIAAFKNLSSLIISKFNDLTNDRLRELLTEMNNTSHNTYLLLENLLDWSLSKTKTLEPDLSQTSSETAIIESIKSIETQAKAKDINIMYNPNEQFEIYVDKKMFTSIIRNLLTNSIKFSYQNSTIELSEKTVYQENIKYYQLTITDKGIGMNTEQIEKILNPEPMLSQSGTDGEKGTGLGLQLCNNFVNLHNGKLQIESKVNFGTTIKINFPA